MPAGQVWAVNTLGGFLSNTKLSKRLRHKAQPLLRFRQFADMSDGSGKGRGDTHVFNKVSNISTAGGTLVETNTMPERQLTMTQGTMTITEYGNSIPFTFKLQLVSDFDVPEMIQKALTNDMAKVLDSAAAAEFQSAHTKVVLVSTTSTVFTTNGTATSTATANMGKANVKDMVDYLRRNNVPPYDGTNYVCVGSTELLSQLKDDMESFDQYTSEGQAQIRDGKFFPKYEGEVGRYYGCRFIEDTAILSNTKGNGSQYGEGVIFGADPVMEAIALPEELRIKVAQDYGRSQGIAWLYVGGFKLVWNRTVDPGGEFRAMHITSG